MEGMADELMVYLDSEIVFVCEQDLGEDGEDGYLYVVIYKHPISGFSADLTFERIFETNNECEIVEFLRDQGAMKLARKVLRFGVGRFTDTESLSNQYQTDYRLTFSRSSNALMRVEFTRAYTVPFSQNVRAIIRALASENAFEIIERLEKSLKSRT